MIKACQQEADSHAPSFLLIRSLCRP